MDLVQIQILPNEDRVCVTKILFDWGSTWLNHESRQCEFKVICIWKIAAFHSLKVDCWLQNPQNHQSRILLGGHIACQVHWSKWIIYHTNCNAPKGTEVPSHVTGFNLFQNDPRPSKICQDWPQSWPNNHKLAKQEEAYWMISEDPSKNATRARVGACSVSVNPARWPKALELFWLMLILTRTAHQLVWKK